MNKIIVDRTPGLAEFLLADLDAVYAIDQQEIGIAFRPRGGDGNGRTAFAITREQSEQLIGSLQRNIAALDAHKNN